MTTRITGTDVAWPADEPIAQERLIEGAPTATTFVTSRTPGGETGLWRVTEGEFTTAHSGYVEHIHIVEGDGDLVHDDGTVIPLSPGVTVTMDDGWRGRWVIRERLTKVYATLNTEAAQ